MTYRCCPTLWCPPPYQSTKHRPCGPPVYVSAGRDILAHAIVHPRHASVHELKGDTLQSLQACRRYRCVCTRATNKCICIYSEIMLVTGVTIRYLGLPMIKYNTNGHVRWPAVMVYVVMVAYSHVTSQHPRG